MSDKIKIAIINTHPSDSIGGSEIQCDIIANKLQEFGHEVTYLALKGDKLYNEAYEVISVELNGKKISELIERVKPDIVYWRNNKKEFLSSVYQINRLGIPVIFAVSHINDLKILVNFKNLDFRNINYFVYSLFKIVNHIWNHIGYLFIHGFTVNNEEFLTKIRNKNKVYIPNSNTLEYVNFTWDKQYIVWVANLKQRKRPELCIEVADKVKKYNIDVIMVGAIQDNKYSYFLDKKNLPQNLYYLGKKSVEEVNGILKSSICLFHTCYPEGFPGNYIQAWLQGKPVISLDIDPGGLITSYKIGKYSHGDMNEFINDIIEMIFNKKLNEKYSMNAKKYAEKNFNPSKNIKMLERFIFELLEGANKTTLQKER